jgi:hypothetical protein
MVRHGFDAAVRMERETRFVVRGMVRVKMLQQKKRIEIIELGRADAPFESHRRVFHDRLWFNGPYDHSGLSVHVLPLSCAFPLLRTKASICWNRHDHTVFEARKTSCPPRF